MADLAPKTPFPQILLPEVIEYIEESYCYITDEHDNQYLWHPAILERKLGDNIFDVKDDIENLPDYVKRNIKRDLEYLLEKLK